jgi:hypothetical protein
VLHQMPTTPNAGGNASINLLINRFVSYSCTIFISRNQLVNNVEAERASLSAGAKHKLHVSVILLSEAVGKLGMVDFDRVARCRPFLQLVPPDASYTDMFALTSIAEWTSCTPSASNITYRREVLKHPQVVVDQSVCHGFVGFKGST